jgi:competence protein ComEC
LPGILARQLDGEHGRWFLWLPVWFGAGIGVYFALPFEPPLIMALAALVFAAAVRVFIRASLAAFIIGSILLCMACGFAAIKLRCEWVAAPVLDRTVKVKILEGWAELWEQQQPKRGY